MLQYKVLAATAEFFEPKNIENTMRKSVRNHIYSPAMIVFSFFYCGLWAATVSFRMLAEFKPFNSFVFEEKQAVIVTGTAVGILMFMPLLMLYVPFIFSDSRSKTQLKSQNVNTKHLCASFLHDKPEAALLTSIQNFSTALKEKGRQHKDVPGITVKVLKQAVNTTYDEVDRSAVPYRVMTASAFLSVLSIMGVVLSITTIEAPFTGILHRRLSASLSLIIPAVLFCITFTSLWICINTTESVAVLRHRKKFLENVEEKMVNIDSGSDLIPDTLHAVLHDANIEATEAIRKLVQA